MTTRAALLLAVVLFASVAALGAAVPHPMRSAAAFPRAILFRGGEVLHTDRVASLEARPVAQSAAEGGDDHGLFLVHVRRGLSEERLCAVGEAVGAPLAEYLPHHTWTVHASAAAVRALADHPDVLWTGELERRHKIAPGLADYLERGSEPAPPARSGAGLFGGGASEKAAAAAGGRDLVVDLVPGPGGRGSVAAAREAWPGAHPAVASVERLDERRALVRLDPGANARAAADAAAWLASRPETAHVSPLPRVRTLNNFARHLVVDGVQVASGSTATVTSWELANITGLGVVVGCADTGITSGSCYFEDDSRSFPFTSSSSSHRKMVRYERFVDGSDGDGHGTHVAGSIAGSQQGSSPGQHSGIAFDARLWFTDIGDSSGGLSTPASAEGLFDGPYDDGAQAHSDSWGYSAPGQTLTRDTNVYDSVTRAYDNFVFAHDDMLVLFAAGNSGGDHLDSTVGAPSTGKNLVSVGASSSTAASWEAYGPSGLASPYDDAGSVAVFSSAGPTSDGRIKPDLVAPGHRILSAQNADGCGTALLSGTSMATPITAGAAALVVQYLRDGHSPTFEAGGRPSAALLRAVLLNGAQPMARRQFESAADGPAVPVLPDLDESPSLDGAGRTVLPVGQTFGTFALAASGACTVFVFEAPAGTATADVTVLSVDGDPDLFVSSSPSVSASSFEFSETTSGGEKLVLDVSSVKTWYVCLNAFGGASAQAAIQVRAFESPAPTFVDDTDCTVTGAHLPLLGSAVSGASYFVRCPSSCPSGTVTGTAQYATSTRVCRAARHAGLVSADSGTHQFVKATRIGTVDSFRGSDGFSGVRSADGERAQAFQLFAGGVSEDGMDVLADSLADDASRHSQGFGLLSLSTSAPLDGGTMEMFVLANGSAASALTAGGDEESAEWCFEASAGGAADEIRATVAWTDPVASLSAGTQLMSNIDLSVRAADGSRTVYGNDAPSAAAADDVNNVERARLPGPFPAGEYCVRVDGASMPAGSQRVALVMTARRGLVTSFDQWPTLGESGSGPSGDPGDLDLGDGSSEEATAGISVAAVLIVIGVLVVVYLLHRRKKAAGQAGSLSHVPMEGAPPRQA